MSATCKRAQSQHRKDGDVTLGVAFFDHRGHLKETVPAPCRPRRVWNYDIQMFGGPCVARVQVYEPGSAAPGFKQGGASPKP